MMSHTSFSAVKKVDIGFVLLSLLIDPFIFSMGKHGLSEN